MKESDYVIVGKLIRKRENIQSTIQELESIKFGSEDDFAPKIVGICAPHTISLPSVLTIYEENDIKRTIINALNRELGKIKEELQQLGVK